MVKKFAKGRSKEEQLISEKSGGSLEFQIARANTKKIDMKRWLEALDVKHQQSSIGQIIIDPGPRVLKHLKKREAGVLLLEKKLKGTVHSCENPQPTGSFGFVSDCVEVSFDSDYAFGRLIIPFSPEALGSVARQSLHLFHWDEKAARFVKVFNSRVSLYGNYVYGRISHPGRYTLIGLNTNPLIRATIGVLASISGLAHLLPEWGGWLKERLCQTLLCESDAELEKFNKDINMLFGSDIFGDGLSLPPDTNRPSIGTLCDLCHNLSSPDLPEIDLLPSPSRFHSTGGVVLAREKPEILMRWTSWEFVGPTHMASLVKQLALDPQNSNRLYACAMNGGIWVLNSVAEYNLWSTWLPLTDRVEIVKTWAFAVAPSNPRVLYAAFGDAWCILYRSDNRGFTWNQVSNDCFLFPTKILIHPNNADFVYLACDGAFCLINTATGQKTDLRSGVFTDAAMDPSNPDVLYICKKEDGIEKSSNGGTTWSQVLKAQFDPVYQEGCIKIALGLRDEYGKDQTAKTRTVAVKADGYVNISNDAGSSWLGWSSGGIGDRSNRPNDKSQFCHNNMIAIDPFDPKIILAGGVYLDRTSDGGITWNRVISQDSHPHCDQQHAVFDPVNRGIVYLANDGGVYRSWDHGKTWYDQSEGFQTLDEIEAGRNLNKGLGVLEFFRAGVHGNSAVATLDHHGIIATNDLSSGIWQRVWLGSWEWATSYADPKRPDRFYIFAGELYAFEGFPPPQDNLSSMFGVFRPYTRPASLTFVGSIAVDIRPGSGLMFVGEEIVVAGGNNKYTLKYTTEANHDKSQWPVAWHEAIACDYHKAENDPIASISFAPSRLAKAYAISYRDGVVFCKDDVDQIGSWQCKGSWPEVNHACNPGGVRQLVVSPLDDQRIYAVRGCESNKPGNVFGRSHLGGQSGSWHNIREGENGLPICEFHSLAAHPDDSGTLYLGTDFGIYITPDEGDNWFLFDTPFGGLPNVEIRQIFIDGDFIYAVPFGRGLWRRKVR